MLLEQEEVNGVRMSWNLLPNTKQDMNKIVVPCGCIFTPLKDALDLKLVAYGALTCRGADCGAVLNPYCYIDFNCRNRFCHSFYTKNDKYIFTPIIYRSG